MRPWLSSAARSRSIKYRRRNCFTAGFIAPSTSVRIDGSIASISSPNIVSFSLGQLLTLSQVWKSRSSSMLVLIVEAVLFTSSYPRLRSCSSTCTANMNHKGISRPAPGHRSHVRNHPLRAIPAYFPSPSYADQGIPPK